MNHLRGRPGGHCECAEEERWRVEIISGKDARVLHQGGGAMSREQDCFETGRAAFILTPPEVVDSVIVHELCHLKEMNHSDRFYREVLRIYPDYWRWDKWLKKMGN
jgi:hypothetical protein